MSIRTKLLLILTSFALLPVLLFGTFVFSDAKKSITEVRIAQLNNIADLKKDKIETFFRERASGITAAQSFHNIRTNLPKLNRMLQEGADLSRGTALKDLDRQIKEFQKAYAYLNVLLTDPTGRIVYSSNSSEKVHIGKTLPEVDFFRKASKEIYFTDVFRNKSFHDRLEMIGAAPLFDFSGAFIGEIVIEIDMGPIYKFISDTTGLGETGEVLIARKEGDAVMFLSPLRHDPDAVLKRKASFRATTGMPAQKAVQGENGSGVTLDYGDREVLAAWRYIPSLRWGLVTKIETNEAFSQITRLKSVVILVGALIVLLAGFAAAVIAKTMTDPIVSLQRGADAVAAGNLVHRVGTDAQDEVGQLSRAIDRMTEALVHDLTWRRQAEKKILTSAYHRSLIEASLDPLVTIDAGGKITDVNLATEAATGRSRGELIGTDFSDYFTDPEKAKAGYVRAFKEGSVKDYELEIRKRDGRITPVLYNAAVYRDEAGNAVGVFAAARDITERKRAEGIAKLDESRTAGILKISQYPAASLRELLDFALDEAIAFSGSKFGYLYFYEEDTQDFILHAWSKDVMAECTIANPQTIYHLEKTGIWGEVVRQRKPVILNDFAAPHPLKKGYPEGHTPLLRFFSVPVFSEGRIVAVTGFANRPTDYTDSDINQMTLLMDSVWKIVERKQAEEEIQKLNQELETRVIERTALLETSNKELEAFAYSVSHDLRAPLRGIDGFSLALLEDYADKLDAEGKDSLERVRAGAVKMGQLIDAMLNLSRLTRGEIKTAEVDLSALAKSAADELAKSEPDRRVEFDIAESVTIKGDPAMLRAVIDNLFENAWKFTGKRDESRIEFGLTQNEGKTAYFVRDNGSGFDMTYANKLFTAFQRLHGTADFPGLGIGLATVQRIVHLHGGSVWAEGEVGKGATFYFTLS